MDMTPLPEIGFHEERRAFLLMLHDALRPLSDPVEIQRTAMVLLCEWFDALRALYADVDPDGDGVTTTEGVEKSPYPLPIRHRISDFAPWMVAAFAAGNTVAVGDVETDPRIDEAGRIAYRALGTGAAVAVPLVKGGRLEAAVIVNHAHAHAWSPDELQILEDVAERTWAAVEQSRAESALRDSEERLRLAMDAAELYTWEIDLVGQSVTYSPNVERITGVWPRTPEEALATVHPDDREIVAQALSVSGANGDRIDYELRATARDGDYGWYQMNGILIRNDAGEAVRAIGTSRVVTARRQVDEALRASEERYRSLFESIDEGYALYEVLFDEEGRPVDALVHEVNPAYEQLMQRTNAAGRKLTELSDGPTPDWIEAMANVVRTQQAQRFERYNDEIDRWFDVYVSPVPTIGDNRIVLAFSDISTRKWATQALEQSEERYRTLFDSIDQGFCTIEVLFDDDGLAQDYRFLEINPAFARNTGLDETAIDQRMRVLAPDHEPYWFDIYGQVARSREPVRFEAEAAALGRWYNVYAYPVGEPAEHKVAVLFEDISERRAALAALQESESRFRTLIQNLPDYAIFLLDPAGIITEWSEGAERITGYPSEDVLGRPVSILYSEEDRASGEWERELAEAARLGRVERELWHERKDGSRYWSNEIVTAVHDAWGNLAGYTKISRDLTTQRAAEEQLLASEERVRAIAEAATDYAIFTVSADARIQDWFAGAESVFGWSAEEAVGQPFAITFTPEDRALGMPERELLQAQESGSAPDVRWHQHKDGSRVFIEGVVRARYNLEGTFLGALKIGQDVTTRRLEAQQRIEREEQTRRELQQQVSDATAELRMLSRRLLSVQEEERRFLARELHDEIGQILTGLVFTLSSGSTGGELAEARRIVGELTDKVRQLSTDLRPAALDAYGLLPALRSHLERYQAQTDIMIELRTAGADRRFPPMVEITAYRVIQEALTNLARHAGTTSGVVQLIGDGTLFVSIRDGGLGFDPSKSTEGTGIGGMRERVELLGGHFELEAAPGQGVAITAELPLDIAGSEPHPGSGQAKGSA